MSAARWRSARGAGRAGADVSVPAAECRVPEALRRLGSGWQGPPAGGRAGMLLTLSVELSTEKSVPGRGGAAGRRRSRGLSGSSVEPGSLGYCAVRRGSPVEGEHEERLEGRGCLVIPRLTAKPAKARAPPYGGLFF